jgi:DNA-directed RNA polymerase alpha subunit
MRNSVAFVLSGYDEGKISAQEAIELIRSSLNVSETSPTPGTYKKMPYGWPAPTDVNLDQPLDETELNYRGWNTLKAAGVKTVRDCYELGETGLLSIHGFGRKGLNDLRDRLLKANQEKGAS